MKNIRELILKFYRCRKKILVLLFFCSLVSSFLFLHFLGRVGPAQHGELNTDYRVCYQPFAESLLRGEWVYISPSPPYPENTVCSTPGYPLFLAAVFTLAGFLGANGLELVLFLNLIIVAFSVCLLFLVADSLFGRKTAIASGFLWMTYPFNLWFLKNPHTEVPFIFVALLGIFLFLSSLKKRKIILMILAGIILGFGVLLRPVSLFFLPLLAALVFFMAQGETLKKKIVFSVVFLAVALLPVFAWEAAVVLKTKETMFLYTDSGPSLAGGLTFGLKSGDGGDSVSVPADVQDLMERAKNSQLTTIPEVLSFSLKELREEPVAFLKLMGLKAARSWYATSQKWWEERILAIQLFYLILAVSGLVLLFWKKKEKMRQTVFLLLLIGYFWIMTIAALSILRYMIPAMAFVIIFSAIAINFLICPLIKKIIFRNEL